MYPFPVGTNLELKLELSDTLLIDAKVVTADPQFGNGIQFLRKRTGYTVLTEEVNLGVCGWLERWMKREG